MFGFNNHDVQRVAVSAIGAATLSAACILGAVAPARAATPTTLPAWQAQVERRMAQVPGDAAERFAATTPQRVAEVTLHFAADGAFTGASLAHGSGDARVDARAIALATGLDYPQLPAGLRGSARDATMRVSLFDAATPAKRRTEMAGTARRAVEVAAR